jgi:hypothetical protein
MGEFVTIPLRTVEHARYSATALISPLLARASHFSRPQAAAANRNGIAWLMTPN